MFMTFIVKKVQYIRINLSGTLAQAPCNIVKRNIFFIAVWKLCGVKIHLICFMVVKVSRPRGIFRLKVNGGDWRSVMTVKER